MLILDDAGSTKGVEGIKMKRKEQTTTAMHVYRISGVPKVVSGRAARYVLECHFVSLVVMSLVICKLREILSGLETNALITCFG